MPTENALTLLKTLSNTLLTPVAPDKITAAEHKELNSKIIDLICLKKPFTDVVTFTSMHTVMEEEIWTSDFNFTVDLENAIPGAKTTYRLLGNSGDSPTNFNDFLNMSGSIAYDYTDLARNLVEFYFDGVDVWVKVTGVI